jgi:hypothetical protein
MSCFLPTLIASRAGHPNLSQNTAPTAKTFKPGFVQLVDTTTYGIFSDKSLLPFTLTKNPENPWWI